MQLGRGKQGHGADRRGSSRFVWERGVLRPRQVALAYLLRRTVAIPRRCRGLCRMMTHGHVNELTAQNKSFHKQRLFNAFSLFFFWLSLLSKNCKPWSGANKRSPCKIKTYFLNLKSNKHLARDLYLDEVLTLTAGAGQLAVPLVAFVQQTLQSGVSQSHTYYVCTY